MVFEITCIRARAYYGGPWESGLVSCSKNIQFCVEENQSVLKQASSLLTMSIQNVKGKTIPLTFCSNNTGISWKKNCFEIIQQPFWPPDIQPSRSNLTCDIWIKLIVLISCWHDFEIFLPYFCQESRILGEKEPPANSLFILRCQILGWIYFHGYLVA